MHFHPPATRPDRPYPREVSRLVLRRQREDHRGEDPAPTIVAARAQEAQRKGGNERCVRERNTQGTPSCTTAAHAAYSSFPLSRFTRANRIRGICGSIASACPQPCLRGAGRHVERARGTLRMVGLLAHRVVTVWAEGRQDWLDGGQAERRRRCSSGWHNQAGRAKPERAHSASPSQDGRGKSKADTSGSYTRRSPISCRRSTTWSCR